VNVGINQFLSILNEFEASNAREGVNAQTVSRSLEIAQKGSVQMLARLSLGKKILFSFVLVLLITITASHFSMTAMVSVDDANKWNEHTYQVLGVTQNVAAAMVDQETGMRGYLLSGDKKFLEPFNAGKASFLTQIEKLKQLTSDNPAQQTRLKDIGEQADAWHKSVVDVELSLMEKPETQADARQLESSGAGKQYMDGIRTKLMEVSGAEQVLLEKRSAQLQVDIDQSRLFLLLGGLGSALAAAFMCWLLVRVVSKPVAGMTAVMVRMAAGENDVVIPSLDRKDEIGSMAAAVEVFRQTALAKIESDRQIEANRSQSEKDRIAQEQADRARAEAMAQATSGLASGLKALSAGNLTVQINERFAPDFEQLRQDFNLAVSQLCSTLTNVAGAAVNIDSGSKEISTGANDLSKRTEQQAAALEETAAALDQITANVKSASLRAEEARHVAMEANASATKSGEVVEHAVNAMSRIEESSNQISNIIGVIDEIAFQTNLLALNAGVEAARAGDAGKGFAVVAQEVRELAQRSASAAKEIKGLIQTSSSEVASGVKLVSDTGDALKSIGAYIVSINQHMEAIALSSREQSVGLAEVNTAVNQMDQTTQQNAAMVEETSAASGSLANEAGNLRQLIGQFDLGLDSGHAHALRQTASRMASPDHASSSRAPARRVANGGSSAAQEWSEF
jgi:methyl-accepting chemotaxis protein